MATTEQTAVGIRADEQPSQRLMPIWLFFLCCAGVFEILYAVLFALTPFPGLHLSSTPIGEQWAWTMRPAQVLSAIISPLINVSTHQEHFSSLLLGAVLVGLMAVYAWAIIVLNRRHQEEESYTCWFWILFGSTCIFGLTLLFQPLLLSDDVFTYIFSGRILAIHGADPLNTAPIQFPADPYLPWVISGRASPNIFGPLWLYLSAVLAALSNQPVITLLIFKSVALLTHLANCVLIWSIMSIIAPGRRLLCTMLYAWNPLVVIELAGSGHNEGILICLLLLATLLYLQSYVRTTTPSPTIPSHALSAYVPYALRGCALFLLGLAISTNLIALLLAPLAIWFDVRTESRMPYAFWKAGWRLAVILLPALCIFLPLWRGASTFFAVTSAVDMEHFVHSPISLLAGPLHKIFTTAALVLGFPLLEQPAAAADVTLRASATFIFVLIYLHLFTRIRRAPATHAEAFKRPDTDRDMLIPGFDTLLSSLGAGVFWYMVLVAGWFWPWYLLWMLWIIVLQRLTIFPSAMLVLSGTALFIYPFVGFSREPVATHQAALIFGLPLVYLILAWGQRRRAERTVSNHGRRS